MDEETLIGNYGELRRSQWWRYREEIIDAAERAVKAGGDPPLEFVGIGMQGVVLCDKRHAFKVARHAGDKRARASSVRMLADEAEWLATASKRPEVRPYVAAFVDWSPKLGVLTRECVRGDPGVWGRSQKVRDVFSHIEPYMLAEGWGMPEFKDDSVVFGANGRGKLVDAGMAHRVSNRLLSFIESVLEGRRKRDPLVFDDDLSTLAWHIRMELQENPKAIARGRSEPAMDERRATNILERLYALGARRG